MESPPEIHPIQPERFSLPENFNQENSWKIWGRADGKFIPGSAKYIVEGNPSLGAGGTSKIYRAWNTGSDGIVAVPL